MANAMPSYTVILLSNKISDADARLVSDDLIKVSDVNKIILAHYMPASFHLNTYLRKNSWCICEQKFSVSKMSLL